MQPQRRHEQPSILTDTSGLIGFSIDHSFDHSRLLDPVFCNTLPYHHHFSVVTDGTSGFVPKSHEWVTRVTWQTDLEKPLFYQADNYETMVLPDKSTLTCLALKRGTSICSRSGREKHGIWQLLHYEDQKNAAKLVYTRLLVALYGNHSLN